MACYTVRIRRLKTHWIGGEAGEAAKAIPILPAAPLSRERPSQQSVSRFSETAHGGERLGFGRLERLFEVLRWKAGKLAYENANGSGNDMTHFWPKRRSDGEVHDEGVPHEM
jgi:hypothetical protein